MILLLGLACTEYGVTEKTPDPLGPAGDTAPPPDTAPPAPADCAVELAAAGTVAQVKTCQAPEVSVSDPWKMEEEWTWKGAADDPAVRQVMMMPAVGNLTDDDGDGRITETDIPDVAFIAWDEDDWAVEHARLVVLDGETGEEHWSQRGFYPFSGLAIADVSGDGVPEVLAVTMEGEVAAVMGDGERTWTSAPFLAASYDPEVEDFIIPMITVADLEEDGVAEVITHSTILSGETGAVLRSLPDEGAVYQMAAVGDIDLDGQQEILFGPDCYSPDGTVEWSSSLSGTYGFWSMIINADDDDEGEVVQIAGGELAVLDTDGSELTRVSAGNDHPGTPCAADFDGDGDVEVAWASNNLFNVYALDGALLWSRAISDATGLLAGCSGYDFDGDGAYEILYADNQRMYVFDGATGTTRLTREEHASTTIWEYPVVADVDGDFSAEIVFASNTLYSKSAGDFPGLVMLGHPDQGWLSSGPTWHVHDFAVTNIDADGAVPTAPEPSWLGENVYRARPAMDNRIGIDLVASITDVCFASCEPDAIVRVAVQLANQGLYAIGPGVPISLFANDGGSLTLLGIVYSEGRLEAGGSAAAVELVISAADVGADGLTVRADELGAGFGLVEECDETNNAGTWTGTCQ